MELIGTVVETLPNTFFRIKIEDTDIVVLCYLAGKMRKNRIRILLGDRVEIDVSEYDTTRGRIIYRL